ncbi:MAG: PAS domain-containing protein [Holosporaceae bacterium]|jgi:PAS domain S-box-containing protein|nr:PAS domain-containing protein [Holosporaceae bacterium]
MEKTDEIKSTIAMFRNFAPEKPISGAVVYFWESHTDNPDDRERTQAAIDLIYKEFDPPACEKYEARTGYLSRYNYLPKPLEKCSEKEIQEAIKSGYCEQERWISRCKPDMPGFVQKDWQECISDVNNPHYKNCRNLVVKKMENDPDFAAAFAKSVSEFASTHGTDTTNGNLYIVEETTWILTLPLLHLNKQIYLFHIGSANSAVTAMFHHFPSLQKAVKWLSPRFTVSSFDNISDFLLDYRNSIHAGHSYAIENRDAVMEITSFKKDSNSKEALSLALAREQTQKALLQSIIGELPIHVYWLDRDNVYLGCNNLQAERLGLRKRDEIVGKTNYDFHPSEEAEFLNEANIRVMETREPYEGEELVSMKSKPGSYLSCKTPLFDPSGEVIGLLGISIDITDRKKAEALEQENQAQRIRIEDQKEFGTFTARILHDIVSPLSSLECIIKTSDVSDEYHATLGDVVGSIKNIFGTLQDKYREYERKSGLAYAGHIHVCLALENIIRNKEYEYKDIGVRFVGSFDSLDKFTFIYGDMLGFERMISNILNNAVEACDKNCGVVEVSVKVEDGKDVKITVRDNGVGMPKKIAEKIMAGVRDFNSTKHEGRGLGLSQAIETVNSYNGVVEVETKEGGGTAFSVKLPISGCPEWLLKQLAFRKGDTVVVLDDDIAVCGVFEKLLGKHTPDLSVKFFTKSRDALDFIESFPQKEKIFFLSDYDLRDGDFSGVAIVLLSNLRKDRVCVLTGTHGSKSLQDMAVNSNVKILLKSFLKDVPVSVA